MIAKSVILIHPLSFHRINLIYGTVCEQCSKESCPTMSGGAKFEYLWQASVHKDYLTRCLTLMSRMELNTKSRFIFLRHNTLPFSWTGWVGQMKVTPLWNNPSQVETQINDEALFPVSDEESFRTCHTLSFSGYDRHPIPKDISASV